MLLVNGKTEIALITRLYTQYVSQTESPGFKRVCQIVWYSHYNDLGKDQAFGVSMFLLHFLHLNFLNLYFYRMSQQTGKWEIAVNTSSFSHKYWFL